MFLLTAPKDIIYLIYDYRDSMDYGLLLNCWLEIIQRDTDKANCSTPYEISQTADAIPTLEALGHNFALSITWTFSLLTTSVTKLFDEYAEYYTMITQDVPFYRHWTTGDRSKDISLTRQLFIKNIIPKMLATIYKHPIYEPLPIGIPELRGLSSLIIEKINWNCNDNGLITPEIQKLIIEGAVRMGIAISW